MMRKLITLPTLISLSFLIFPKIASAHEAYVLTPKQFHDGLQIFTPNPLGSLFDATHLGMFLMISLIVGSTYLITLLWSTTSWSEWLDKLVRKARVIGPVLVRTTASSAFIIAAISDCIFGPELPLASLPFGEVARALEFIIGIMILFGSFVELAGLIGLGLFIYTTINYGAYLVTYANYFGEVLVLMLFGSRFFSVDRLLFGKKVFIKSLEKLRHYETPIIRVLYGVALIYAGYTIKFLHQNLTVLVYNEYHLKSFFNSDASFIAAGAGLAEIMIGFFIMIGFMQRLTILISLVFITLSLMYFKELVWPHFLLYGLSFNLLINSADWLTVDRYFVPWVKGLIGKYVLHKHH